MRFTEHTELYECPKRSIMQRGTTAQRDVSCPISTLLLRHWDFRQPLYANILVGYRIPHIVRELPIGSADV